MKIYNLKVNKIPDWIDQKILATKIIIDNNQFEDVYLRTNLDLNTSNPIQNSSSIHLTEPTKIERVPERLDNNYVSP